MRGVGAKGRMKDEAKAHRAASAASFGERVGCVPDEGTKGRRECCPGNL